ncbi:MAG TPA: serine/threonine-protein kinase [Longimicrobiaceae bacterium]|nr:serine/threonine-protein kinase [Longimicrobiaceae bacterium]
MAPRLSSHLPLLDDHAFVLILELTEQVARCHAHGIIHRDIKPSNILLMEDGNARLIDFDVAAYRGARSTLPGYEDVRIGTLPYSAPEQILDPATATYETADIFSLGVVLYEMLTGRIPFPMTDDESEEEYRARLPFADPVPPRTYRPDLPAEIEAVILRAMARDPAARHQSVAELREHLEAALRAAEPPPLHDAPLPRREILLWAGLGLALAALLAWIFAGA